MTFTRKFAVKKLLVGSLAAVALSLSVGATASVSAVSNNGNGHGNGNGNSQQGVHDVKIGVQQKTNVGTKQGAMGVANNGNGNGSSGYGGTNVDVDQNVFVQIGNVIGGAVNITINFVNNIFS